MIETGDRLAYFSNTLTPAGAGPTSFVYLSSTNPAGNPSAPGANSFSKGAVFDVSGFDSWSLFVNTQNALNPGPLVELLWYDQITDVDEPSDVDILLITEFSLASLTQCQVFGTTGEVDMIAGRVLAPLVSVSIANLNGASTWGPSQVAFHAHNRTRLHDAPYTPKNLGGILGLIPDVTLAPGAAATPAPLPYYMGPAQISANIDNLGTQQVHIADDNAAPNRIASIFTAAPPGDLWIPSLASGATVWQLTARVNSNAGANKTIGASCVAGG